MATATKTTTMTQAQIVKKLHFTEGATLAELKAYRTFLNEAIKAHDDYVTPSKKPHLEARKQSVTNILLLTYGFSGAFNRAKALISEDGLKGTDGEIIKQDPADWVEDGVELNQKALDFVTGGLAQTKVFMTKAMAEQRKFTPKDIIDTWAKAYGSTTESFIKKQNLYLKTSKNK